VLPTGNCSHWVFVEEAPNVFRLLLEVGAAQKLDPQETPAKGYRDIVTTRHDSGFDYTVRRYRFDGSQYRPSDCVEHHYATADDDCGGRRGSRRPTVTPCGRD
jgi:hypothetical protein